VRAQITIITPHQAYITNLFHPPSLCSSLPNTHPPHKTGGGMPLTTNRTKWPTTGGALSFQPGWQTGHKTALIYINMGLETVPRNYSMIMLPVFQIILPSNEQDQGASVCLPQVPLPVGVSVRAGDNATIQLVESAQHGAGLYNVSFPLGLCFVFGYGGGVVGKKAWFMCVLCVCFVREDIWDAMRLNRY